MSLFKKLFCIIIAGIIVSSATVCVPAFAENVSANTAYSYASKCMKEVKSEAEPKPAPARQKEGTSAETTLRSEDLPLETGAVTWEQKESKPLPIVLFILGGIAVVGLGSLVAFIVIRKKNKGWH